MGNKETHEKRTPERQSRRRVQCRGMKRQKVVLIPNPSGWLRTKVEQSLLSHRNAALNLAESSDFPPTDQNIERPVQISSQGAKQLASESKYWFAGSCSLLDIDRARSNSGTIRRLISQIWQALTTSTTLSINPVMDWQMWLIAKSQMLLTSGVHVYSCVVITCCDLIVFSLLIGHYSVCFLVPLCSVGFTNTSWASLFFDVDTCQDSWLGDQHIWLWVSHCHWHHIYVLL